MSEQQPVSEREFRMGRQLAATQEELKVVRETATRLLAAMYQSTKITSEDFRQERERLRQSMESPNRPTLQPL
jgi:Spy/CpxP family protein refolding chaperone